MPGRGTPSWPGLSRPSTSFLLRGSEDVDARNKCGHDGGRVLARTSSVIKGLQPGRDAELLQLRFALGVFLGEFDLGDGDEDLGPRF